MLGVGPGTGSLEKAARGPELSAGGKRELEQVLAKVCRLLNSKGARCMGENQFPIGSEMLSRLEFVPQES